MEIVVNIVNGDWILVSAVFDFIQCQGFSRLQAFSPKSEFAPIHDTFVPLTSDFTPQRKGMIND